MSFITIEQVEREAAERRQKHNPLAKDMTLRDYCAGLAMQGMMVDVEQPRCGYIADTAYEMADAMLKARNK